MILDHVSFDIPQNKTTVFLGKNGSGKTSSLRCLNLLQKINSGRIESFGNDPLPMLFQSPVIFEGDVLYILPSMSLVNYQKRFKERVNASFSFGA